MKEGLLKAGIGMLNMIYAFFRLLPVKKKIVYISRQSNEVPSDFRLVADEMIRRHPEYDNVMLVKTIDSGIAAKIRYCGHMLCQMYHIATSRMVILDSYCMAVSLLRQRPELVVIQMWHAMGSLKKFGYSILDKGEGSSGKLAEAMHMHRNYTHVFCSSKFCKPFFAEAFHVSLEKMVVMPLPRLDMLEDKAYTAQIEGRIKEVYPQLNEEGKEILVYAPTFRKEEAELQDRIKALADAIDYSRYHLILKLHPVSKVKFEHSRMIVDSQFTTIDFCRIADKVILDYSAVVFEIMILKKPLYFYMFDYETYMAKRDFYINYREYLPGRESDSLSDLLNALEEKDTDFSRQEKFREMMLCERTQGTYTGAVVDFMEKTGGF